MLAVVAAALTAGPLWDRLSGYVERNLAAAGDPGAALVLVDHRGIVRCRGFGLDGAGRPVDCRTPFAVASLTKGMTALALERLAARETVDWNAPARRYLPWFRFGDDDRTNAITLERLGTMRTGFTLGDGRASLADPSADDAALERRVRVLEHAAAGALPGTTFEYSNANYDVLGAVLAAASGTSFEAALQREVFAPLGLAHAALRRPVGMRGFVRWFGVPVHAPAEPPVRADAPAAGAVVDATDYGRYLAAHLDAGRSWSRAVLSPEGWAHLHRSPADTPYALGWFEIVQTNRHELRHGGDAPDYHAWALFRPDLDVGFALFVNANASSDGERAWRFDGALGRIVAGEEPPDATAFPPELGSRLPAVAGIVALVIALVRAGRASDRQCAIGIAIDVLVLTAVVAFAIPAMGGNLRVGYVYAPDLTLLLIALVTLSSAHAASAGAILLRRRRAQRAALP